MNKTLITINNFNDISTGQLFFEVKLWFQQIDPLI